MGVSALRRMLPLLVLAAVLWSPARGRAQERTRSTTDAVSLLSYGFRGFWTGAELGLAVGYLSTGRRYESREWRKLVLGAGIGAVAGVGTGLALAMVDAADGAPGTGWFVLRDMGYASMLGTLTGAAVGALFWAGSGHAKDVLIGLSIGTLAGAAVGVVFGVIEGAGSRRRRAASAEQARGLQLTLTVAPVRGGPTAFGPGLRGHF